MLVLRQVFAMMELVLLMTNLMRLGLVMYCIYESGSTAYRCPKSRASSEHGQSGMAMRSFSAQLFLSL